MKFNRFYFLIFVVTIVLALFSCEKEIKSNEKNTFSTYTEKAQQFQDQVKFDSAFYYYTKAKNSFPEPTNEQLAFLSLQIATLQQHQGDYFGCEETITEALKEYKGTLYLPYLYNILAVSYQKQHDFYHALRYYQNAFTTSTDSLSKAIFQNNIGLIYIENKQFKQAQTILENLISNKNIRENKFEFARVQDNLGYTQFQLKNKNAIDLLLNAKQLRDSLTDYIGLIASNMHLAEYYQNSDKEIAKKYADLAYQSSLKANNPDDQLEALKWLSDFSSPIEAKNYYKSYIQLNDSLVKARNSAKNQF
jgi:tetratricopeptide (TPR) repeat protein